MHLRMRVDVRAGCGPAKPQVTGLQASAAKGKGKAKAPGAGAAAEGSTGMKQANEAKRKALFAADFPRASEAQRPEMEWRRNGKMVQELIASRFGEDGRGPRIIAVPRSAKRPAPPRSRAWPARSAGP